MFQILLICVKKLPCGKDDNCLRRLRDQTRWMRNDLGNHVVAYKSFRQIRHFSVDYWLNCYFDANLEKWSTSFWLGFEGICSGTAASSIWPGSFAPNSTQPLWPICWLATCSEAWTFCTAKPGVCFMATWRQATCWWTWPPTDVACPWCSSTLALVDFGVCSISCLFWKYGWIIPTL